MFLSSYENKFKKRRVSGQHLRVSSSLDIMDLLLIHNASLEACSQDRIESYQIQLTL